MRFPWQKKTDRAFVNSTTAISCNIYCLSETGPARSSNEDRILYFCPGQNQDAWFAMVADGMGGHNAGEVASRIACESARAYMEREYNRHEAKKMLKALVQVMHHNIRTTSANDPACSGMGTTSTAVFISGNTLSFAHVGDSRLYFFSNNELVQCTTDQTLVTQMIREGKVKPEEARNHDMKHVLMQALGTADQVSPQIGGPLPVHPGDYYFLCSDGIYDMLSDAELALLFSMRRPEFAMECIKALCFERVARDNFSALLIEINAGQEVISNGVTKEQNIML
ncbi:protein phosphatase 2C domain-containing protein [Agriterribacter sp.]|uniref:PP2C family protein-serine/threonine phosphatase n=1 Tax=Agriterribacter sp. TaxID=2821509 RepID=UPI002BCAC394|nr:protein phosphatase 2C domain-containing protein [Agriterribacter sp.]HRO47928.1 protein phosphatase 2C domain-containing protein [Agriterribacter sp.]HRQ19106.1 protein phosphatase 2C domain-containing protein [Agriterribacter sp.]